MSFLVRGLAIHSDGMTIDYLVPEQDVRDNGLLQNRVLLVPAIEDYSSVLDDVIEAIHALLGRALEDFNTLPAAEPEEDFDDDSSPYDNPLERDVSTSADTAQEGDRP